MQSGVLIGSSNTQVAYCFAEVPGFSKFGSYTGNGSADGPFVYCGFRPRWILVKRVDAASDWVIYDAARSPNNIVSAALYPYLANAEGTVTFTDFTSQGFKIRDSAFNQNGGTYIYAAFADLPFQLAPAR